MLYSVEFEVISNTINGIYEKPDYAAVDEEFKYVIEWNTKWWYIQHQRRTNEEKANYIIRVSGGIFSNRYVHVYSYIYNTHILYVCSHFNGLRVNKT